MLIAFNKVRRGRAWHVVGCPPRLAGVPLGIRCPFLRLCAAIAPVSAGGSSPPCGYRGEQHPASGDGDLGLRLGSVRGGVGRGEGRKLWDPGATSLCWPAGLWDRCLDACAPSRGAPQFPAARSGPLNILCPGDGGSVCFSKVSSSRWRTGLAFCTPASRTGPGPERVQEYVEGQQLPFP